MQIQPGCSVGAHQKPGRLFHKLLENLLHKFVNRAWPEKDQRNFSPISGVISLPPMGEVANDGLSRPRCVISSGMGYAKFFGHPHEHGGNETLPPSPMARDRLTAHEPWFVH